jgi:hypothetical protein
LAGDDIGNAVREKFLNSNLEGSEGESAVRSGFWREMTMAATMNNVMGDRHATSAIR